MSSRISWRLWVLIRVLVGLFWVSFWGERHAPAQGIDGAIEHRLVRLEERLARLEAENQQLRERLAGIESFRQVAAQTPVPQRSEERRVGKECRL